MIRKELAALEADQFAILFADELNYIQTLNDPKQGWIVEYQVNSTDEHYDAADSPHELATVIAAFVAYAAGDSKWLKLFRWERMELVEKDFLVVSAVPKDAIDNGENPLEAEDFVELPEIGVPLFAELCAIVTDTTAAAAAKKLKVVGEIEPAGMDPVKLIPLPANFVLGFASLRANDAAKLADQ